MNLLDYPSIHILFPLLLVAFVNKNMRTKQYMPNNPFLPPGYIIGIVWFVLFGLLGYVTFILYKQKKWIAYILIWLLLLFYISYPYLTIGFRNMKTIKMLNVIALIVTVFVSTYIFIINKKTFYFMVPVLLWLLYVNLVV
jgi:tryptophan-rich sensory protein